MTTRLAQGAEAIIYTDYNTVTKERFEKKYRHPTLDKELRKFRTRRESKILEKLQEMKFPAPRLIEMDDSTMKVNMDHVPGDTLKKAIDALEEKKDSKRYLALCKEIGEKIATLHNAGIVHHDLTTSNMILHRDEDKVYFIDFGLSFFSEKVEDYAVDLHLFKHALESRHYRIWEKCFNIAMAGYKKKAKKGDETMKRLETVEKRGRYKGKH
jgi:TP53 regulating kinase-like protein